jgi:hypothetical protein
MKTRAQLPDVEHLVIDLLQALISPLETVTVGLGVPEGWTPAATPHLQVEAIGSPFRSLHPVAGKESVRVIAHAGTTSEAKRLVSLAEGLLLAHAGGSGISSIKPATHALGARDPDTRAELASVMVTVMARTEPIPQGS